MEMLFEDGRRKIRSVEAESRAYLVFPSFPEVENKEAW